MSQKEVQNCFLDWDNATDIKKIDDFKRNFFGVSLPQFTGELYAFNFRIKVIGENFKFSFDSLPSENPRTSDSGIIEIKNCVEDVGLAHREAAIFTPISFEHDANTDHLLFSLKIFVAGTSWATSLYGHV